ncbi:hypothetical protein BT63DRAFT_428400 [Microthyrium microscopicum]|uniref:RNase III domain-containing protein n=1 Tax=Microthyrium microscopicum TaxID=703497 RepID=A0A6A6U1C2_9PEZI|nr:hypothetical protein BT63DRAFT_428400 [Microthyrium microscopicum]
MDPKTAVQRLSHPTSLLYSSSRIASKRHCAALSRSNNTLRQFSSSLSSQVQISLPLETSTDSHEVPRWRQTPRQMKMPFQVRIPANQRPHPVNEDPEVLNKVYDKLLGKGGWRSLTEETRWLAVTHKSFDQGRRGFNDRLSYFGKRIVELQCSIGLMNSPNPLEKLSASSRKGDIESDPLRQPFKDPHLGGVEGLTERMKKETLKSDRLFRAAVKLGIGEVVRWKPRVSEDLYKSGYVPVVTQSLYAIIGAIALERGEPAAVQVARRVILEPSGLFYSERTSRA